MASDDDVETLVKFLESEILSEISDEVINYLFASGYVYIYIYFMY